MQPQATPTLQAGGQLGEVVAVEVEDDLQRLPAALNVVEDIGVCGRTWGGGQTGHHPSPGEPCPPSLGQLQTFLQTSSGMSCSPHPRGAALDTRASYLQGGILGHPVCPQTSLPSHPPGVASDSPVLPCSEEQPLTSLFTSFNKSQFPLLNP